MKKALSPKTRALSVSLAFHALSAGVLWALAGRLPARLPRPGEGPAGVATDLAFRAPEPEIPLFEPREDARRHVTPEVEDPSLEEFLRRNPAPPESDPVETSPVLRAEAPDRPRVRAEAYRTRVRVPNAPPAPAPAPPRALETPAAVPKEGENPRPSYPLLARLRGWEGRVLLEARVGPDGRPLEVRVLESSGHEILDQAARGTVAAWRFHPARGENGPIESTVRVPVRFVLTR